MKKGLDGFWRPTNQNFAFRPFIFFLKNNKDWCAWRLKRTTSCLITVFYHKANGRSGFKICTIENVLLLKTMQIMLQTSERSIFCPFFFYYKKKRAEDRRHFIQALFQAYIVIYIYIYGKACQTLNFHYILGKPGSI